MSFTIMYNYFITINQVTLIRKNKNNNETKDNYNIKIDRIVLQKDQNTKLLKSHCLINPSV